MSMKVITSFTSHKTAEGTWLSATFSEINEQGQIIRSNERFNLVVVDSEIQEAIDLINQFLNDRIPEE